MIGSILGDAAFVESGELLFLLFRFFLNITCAYVLIDLIYRKINQQREYIFTFYLFNILIFFVSSLLSGVKMKTGFAFGLFAIFSILRYRTEAVGIKEMTFLFINIIMAVMNSRVTHSLPLSELLFANIVVILSTYLLEKRWLKGHRTAIDILFEDISLVHIDKRDEMIVGLRERTGFRVIDYEILSIDYLRDCAKLKVYYE